ncbi:MAG: carboxylating nicotinate-nucleotide diphosphorylase [Candidatus Aureabacteria bacterium]|nr:carboxylating nicotinate-nucleotide diphosphorylase [Candidatus Auribacterota bacterium]
MVKIDPAIISDAVARALKEDVGTEDVTTLAVVPPNEAVEAAIVAKEECVVAGLPVADAVFAHLDPRVKFEALVRDGSVVSRGERMALLHGYASPILTGERVALNFLQHLSGIATLTRKVVDLVKDTGATILDTRKTMPGLRYLEKYAVAMGGGTNHRMGLFDRVLIKDNHLRIQLRYGADAIARAVALVREKRPGMPIEVEADSIEAVEAAVDAKADCILLDNMTADEIKEAVGLINGRASIEASGGITLENVREIALAGAQFISIGCLTHSAKAADISLDILT